MTKFKYGPLVWNHIEDEDDSGNYWWPGLPPVSYDETEIPIDVRGLQCLPMHSPLHPDYESKDFVFNSHINDYLPTIKEWADWFDEHFIEITDYRIKREILKWYVKNSKKVTANFLNLQSKCSSLDEMVEIVWPPEENK